MKISSQVFIKSYTNVYENINLNIPDNINTSIHENIKRNIHEIQIFTKITREIFTEMWGEIWECINLQKMRALAARKAALSLMPTIWTLHQLVCKCILSYLENVQFHNTVAFSYFIFGKCTNSYFANVYFHIWQTYTFIFQKC